jgi:hypothetical protein
MQPLENTPYIPEMNLVGRVHPALTSKHTGQCSRCQVFDAAKAIAILMEVAPPLDMIFHPSSPGSPDPRPSTFYPPGREAHTSDFSLLSSDRLPG